MSLASDKGRNLEKQVAAILRKKLGARVERDKRSGAGSHQKMDISDWYQDTPLDLEIKNHKVIKIREWFKQCLAGSSLSRVPTVVFAMDEEVMAVLRFSDLVDLIAETQQGREEIKLLRTPVVVPGLKQAVEKAAERETACRNGHITSPGSNKCLAKGCPYSSSYKAKKVKPGKS